MSSCETALISLNVPTSSKDSFYNDLMLEHVLGVCTQLLYIYLNGEYIKALYLFYRNPNSNYMEVLSPRIWDLANCKGKPTLKFNIIPAYQDPSKFCSYESLLQIPVLNIVFLVKNDNIDERERINKERESKSLTPVIFYSLECYLKHNQLREWCIFVEDNPEERFNIVYSFYEINLIRLQ